MRFDQIAEETFVMVPDGCGLSHATRALFRNHRRKLKAYPGAALSYQVLEQWAAMGLGAAILPQSRIQDSARGARVLTGNDGKALTIDFEAIWLKTDVPSEHHKQFSFFLQSNKDFCQNVQRC